MQNTYPSFTLEELLVNPSDKQTNKLRRRLLLDGVKAPVCEQCGIDQWNGQPAPLELDHCDGNRRNNTIQNLRILCPNCHAQTDTYRGLNIGRVD